MFKFDLELSKRGNEYLACSYTYWEIHSQNICIEQNIVPEHWASAGNLEASNEAKLTTMFLCKTTINEQKEQATIWAAKNVPIPVGTESSGNVVLLYQVNAVL